MKKHTAPPIELALARHDFSTGLNLDWRDHSTAMAILRGIQHKREKEAQARRKMLVLPGVVMRR